MKCRVGPGAEVRRGHLRDRGGGSDPSSAGEQVRGEQHDLPTGNAEQTFRGRTQWDIVHMDPEGGLGDSGPAGTPLRDKGEAEACSGEGGKGGCWRQNGEGT